ncbi:MAG: sulfide dehydrogenase [Gammaproteobacteria bacterium SG8_11]|nr:MAG: sulfide dehydrogenase [Gammaproteobacteria bacterium SG8_11]
MLWGSLPVIAELPSATMLANTCAGCHGTNGASVGPASPTIAGISRDYFIQSMLDYQSGKRPSTIMQRIAKGYSEAEIELMAEYFSQQPFAHQAQEHDVKQADFGRRLHKKYCALCHEDGGRHADDDAGILAGQWAAYLRFTMQDFTREEREMENKMKQRLEKLQADHGEQGVEALIHYYASQQ